MHLPRQADGSYLLSGPPPGDERYEIIVPLPDRPVNAIRLEAMRDPSLPYGGPGLNPDNGNIVLTEIEFHAFAAGTGLLGRGHCASRDRPGDGRPFPAQLRHHGHHRWRSIRGEWLGDSQGW